MNEIEQMKVLRESIERLEEGSYWGGNGQYEKQAQELQELVPPSGPAKTLRGEIMRAASKIYYDYHNNGFGNTWDAPAQFLMNLVAFSDRVKEMLWDHAMGNIGHDVDAEVEEMMNTVVEQIYEMPDQENTTDMWDTPVDEHKFAPDQNEEDDWDDPDDYDNEEDDWDDEDEF